MHPDDLTSVSRMPSARAAMWPSATGTWIGRQGWPAAATPAPRLAQAVPGGPSCAAPEARSAAAAGRAGGAPREGQRHGRDSVVRAPDKDQGLFNVRASTRLDNVVEFRIKEYEISN